MQAQSLSLTGQHHHRHVLVLIPSQVTPVLPVTVGFLQVLDLEHAHSACLTEWMLCPVMGLSRLEDFRWQKTKTRKQNILMTAYRKWLNTILINFSHKIKNIFAFKEKWRLATEDTVKLFCLTVLIYIILSFAWIQQNFNHLTVCEEGDGFDKPSYQF